MAKMIKLDTCMNDTVKFPLPLSSGVCILIREGDAEIQYIQSKNFSNQTSRPGTRALERRVPCD